VPKVTQEHLDARRKEILDGARRAFAEHGYEGATVARLEEATGMSRGAIFHYFENKNDLFVELAMEMNTRFGDILLERGLDEAFRALTAENPEWIAVLIETESRLRHDEDFVRRFEAKAADASPRIRDWFHDQQAAGNLRDDVSWEELGRFATALLNGLALRIASGDPFDIEAMLQLLGDAIAPQRKRIAKRPPARPPAVRGGARAGRG
jgi:TetR/AcrR family transcriptional regulator, transcriptional repressor of aconitase